LISALELPPPSAELVDFIDAFPLLLKLPLSYEFDYFLLPLKVPGFL